MSHELAVDIIALPDAGTFQKKYVNTAKPVVIKGLVDNWPALHKWSVEYFSKNFGNVYTGNISVKDGNCEFNVVTGSRLHYQQLQDSLDIIASGNVQNGTAIATPADVFPEAIKSDYSPHIFCRDKKFLRDRIFIGAANTVTSLHQDLFHNLYTMVKGSKTITLYAPYAPVYPNSRFSKLPNHAQVDPENPDYRQFPNFKHATPYVITLNAGETLFIPPFWWHHLRNKEESIAVSFWWAEGLTLPLAWVAAQYKKLRKI
jgi:hypothetical protein